MKLRRSQIQNMLLLVLVVVLLFTPVGTKLKVQLNRLLAFSPSLVSQEDRAKVSTYHWSLKGMDDKLFEFKEAQDKVILLNFWATWCPPCIAEMPSMQELYNSYGDRVVFLFVSEEPAEKIQEFMDKHQYDFPVYQSISAPPQIFGHESIPQTYLIDQAGEIIIDKSGAADWNSDKVHQILDKLLNP